MADQQPSDWDALQAEFDAQRWEVSTSPVGGSVHVYPLKGMVTVEAWAGYFSTYPRTERGLRKAIARCQRWCDKRNAAEDRAKALAGRVRS